MKLLFLCVLLTICYSVPIEKVQSLRATNWTFTDVIHDGDPLTIELRWAKVKNVDDSDPIVGYKIHLWEVKKIKKIKNINHPNGTVERVEIETHPRAKVINGKNVIPDGKLTILEAPADNPMVLIEGIKLEVPYQFTITAYTSKMVGQPSAISGFKYHAPDWKSKNEQ